MNEPFQELKITATPQQLEAELVKLFDRMWWTAAGCPKATAPAN